jgi:hypothetical protein
MGFNNPTDYSQTKPGTLYLGRGQNGLESPFTLFFGHAFARVFEFEHDLLGLIAILYRPRPYR